MEDAIEASGTAMRGHERTEEGGSTLTVGVKHFRHELHDRSLVGVLFRELENQLEGSAVPRRVLRAEDHGVPAHDVLRDG